MAHEDIQPTREWVEEIERALLSCDALVAVLSPGFKESNWTDQEVGFCHGRRVLIVSVRAGLDPYGFISRYQALQGHGQSSTIVAAQLYKILVTHQKTSARIGEALVHRFEHSDSFAEAKDNVTRLDDIQNWTPEMLRRVEAAVKDNFQLNHAWGVPAQVERLLKRNGAGGVANGREAALPGAYEDESEELPL